MEIKTFIKDYWAVIVSCIGLITSIIIVWRYKIPNIEERLAKVESTAHRQEVTKLDLSKAVTKAELYQEDGTLIYQQTDGCRTMQEACQKTICLKMDEVKLLMDGKMESIEEKMREMDESRESTRNEIKSIMREFHEQQVEVVKVATQVRSLLATSQAQQTAIIVKEVVKELKLNGLT
jgi:MFS superfamily sulfate permease-like transporter